MERAICYAGLANRITFLTISNRIVFVIGFPGDDHLAGRMRANLTDFTAFTEQSYISFCGQLDYMHNV